MTRASVLARGRQFTEATMTDQCVIGIATEVVDPTTLNTTRTITTQHYAGVCKLSFPAGAVSEEHPAGQQVAEQTGILSLPISSSATVATGDIVIMGTSVFNPSLPGRRLRIKGLHDQSYSTARRFPVEELS